MSTLQGELTEHVECSIYYYSVLCPGISAPIWPTILTIAFVCSICISSASAKTSLGIAKTNLINSYFFYSVLAIIIYQKLLIVSKYVFKYSCGPSLFNISGHVKFVVIRLINNLI